MTALGLMRYTIGSWCGSVIVSCVVAIVLLNALGCTTAAERLPRQGPWPAEPVVVNDPRFGVFVRGRVDAVLGERLVVPVELAGGFLPEDIGRVVLDDGRRLRTEVVWIGVNGLRSQSGSWLPPSGSWIAVPADEMAEPGSPTTEAGTWVLVIDPPIDAVGQGFWIAGQRTSVNWLPDPFEVSRRVPGDAWSSPVGSTIRVSRSVQARIEPERRSPTRRWRARLFSNGLLVPAERRVVDPDGTVRRQQHGRLEDVAFDIFADPTLEAIARLTEARWLIGLARLYESDSELNLAVRRRLTTHVDFGDGAIAPVWPIDQENIDRLLSDLTNQRLTPRERARRAQIWLAGQPAGARWVLSDAGLKTTNGSPVTTVGLANFEWSPSAATIEAYDGGQVSLLDPVPALTARVASVASRSPGTTRSAVVASVGGESEALVASAADLVAVPPGLRIERLIDDWTLPSFLMGAAPTPVGRADDGASVLFYRDHLSRWVIYAECRLGVADDLSGETIGVSFGPAGSATDLTVLVEPSGEFVVNRPAGLATIDATRQPEIAIDTGEFPGGWFVRMIVPPLVIEDGRTLRLGLERIDAAGRRSAWPRAMLPWQTAVGRAAIDLSAWDE